MADINMKRTFIIDFSAYGEDIAQAVIELDQAVIDAVDDDWRAMLYNLNTPEEIAEHIGYNLIFNRCRLSQLDGWADQPDANARVLDWPDLNVLEMSVKEINKL